MSDFSPFSKAIHAQYNKLAKQDLFVTTQDKDALVAHYLASFPEGTNPIYKNYTEHDCSCCKQFIKNIGNLVGIVDGKVESVWQVTGLAYPYDVVAKAMDEYVTAHAITGIFRSCEPRYGAETTKQMLEDGSVKKWNHFHAEVGGKFFTKHVGEQVGAANTNVQTLKRGLEELSPDAVKQTLELLESNALYRGQEHLHAVQAFARAQTTYLALDFKQREIFLWLNQGTPIAHFRNTVIGTLIQDLTTTGDTEASVRAFEAKVAPANYKRPKPLVTPRMVEDAMKTIKELDYEDSLTRRMARISDVGVTNVLWVNNETQAKMKGGIENVLMAAAKSSVKLKEEDAKDISIDDFMTNVLPNVTGMEVLVKNKHAPNFVTLTAPVHDNPKPLFVWPNNFAWSYSGNVTDSIKERVKAAGGRVEGCALRVSLAWYNNDDLDLHCATPRGNHVFYGNRQAILDVDMNGLSGMSKDRKPVENMSFDQLRDGTYKFWVNQFRVRETSDTGFEIEVENEGKVQNFKYDYPVRGGYSVELFTIKVKQGRMVELEIMDQGLTNERKSKQVWGVATEQFVKVNTLMNSPNFWDGNAVGNKHWFFMLENCKNDQSTRGIYNEFLIPELTKHRRVFELLGDKTKCPPTDDQLSGVGFSSTSGAEVTVKVTGTKLNQTFNVKF